MAVADFPMKPIDDARDTGTNHRSVGPQADQDSKLSYMQRPPAILPNYGNRWKHGPRLKTNLPRVLLYDNVTQQTDIAVNMSIFQLIVDFLARLRSVVCHCFLSGRLTYLILDAQISYIQSQRYKSRRHLDMNIKSFLLWKQRKDKALLKLTQVQHGYDYAHFELEYHGGVSRPDKTRSVNCNSSLVLPNIQREKLRRITETTSRQENGKEKQKDCLPALAYLLRKERYTTLAGLPSHSAQENQTQHLPSMMNMTPPKASNNSSLERNSSLRLEQQRNTKPQFEHNSSDVTSFTDPSFNTLSISRNQVFMKSPTVYTNTSTNALGDNKSTYVGDNMKTNPDKHKAEINNIVVNNKNSKEFQRNKQVKMKQPVFDSRFLRLQNILVPQCPRNEGFTALSPSFQNKKYFHYA